MNSLIDSAVRKLSEQSLSEQALRRHLETEFAALPNLDSRIDAVFERLNELQLLNDLRLAKSLAARYAHKGNRVIARLLAQKGFQALVIKQAMASLDEELSRALEEARRKIVAEGATTQSSAALLERFLTGRGFSEATIDTVMQKLDDTRPYRLRRAA